VEFAIVCSVQQAMFVVGEPISFYQGIRVAAMSKGLDVFADDRIYLDPALSPAIHLLHPDAVIGSLALRGLALQPLVAWALLSAATAAVVAVVVRGALGAQPASSAPREADR
jgi:hypothetical protein